MDPVTLGSLKICTLCVNPEASHFTALNQIEEKPPVSGTYLLISETVGKIHVTWFVFTAFSTNTLVIVADTVINDQAVRLET